MSENANAPLQAWEAYGDLIELVKDHMKWKRIQLVDALNADAVSKSLPQCKYSLRGIESLKASPKKGKSSRKPRLPRLKHLHGFFSEKIRELSNFGRIKADAYMQHLAAIAPQQLSSDVLNLKNIEGIVVQQGKTIPLEKVIRMLQQILQDQLGISDQGIPATKGFDGDASNLQDSALGRVVFPETITRESKPPLESENNSQNELYKRACSKFLAYQYGAANRLFLQFATDKYSIVKDFWQKRRQIANEALWAFYVAAICGLHKRRFERPLVPMNRAFQEAVRAGDLYLMSKIQLYLALLYSAIAENKTGVVAAKYRKRAVAANRSALKFVSFKEFPNEWIMAQHNLGSTLMEQARFSPSKIALGLMTEAIHAFRALPKSSKKDEYAYYSKTLGQALLAQYRTGISLWGKTNIDFNRLFRQTKAAFNASLKWISFEKSPELWTDLQNGIGLMLIYKAVQAKHECLGSPKQPKVLKHLCEAQQVLQNALNCAAKNVTSSTLKPLKENLALVESILFQLHKNSFV